MPPDKLAVHRAQRQRQDAQNHEMTPLGGGSYLSPAYPDNGNLNGSGDTLGSFFSQVTSVDNDIIEFGRNVSRIAELHSHVINSTGESARRQNEVALDELVGQTRQLSNELKEKLQALSSYSVIRTQDESIRNNQAALLRQKFVGALQNYQQVEQDYRMKYKQRLERQFRIVKPDATPEEVAAAVNDLDGSGSLIFTQALSSSARYGESRAAYQDAQDRRKDVQKIARTIAELGQLFADMSVLVAQQEDVLEDIEHKAERARLDVESGLKETEIAVGYAWSARRMRILCFWLCVAIIAILALVLGLHFGLRNN